MSTPDRHSGRPPLRMGVVGVGYFGRLHAEKIAALDCARLVAVADLDPARAEEVGNRFNVAGRSDFKSLTGEVDAVCIAVPTSAHFEVASAFLDAGVHVLLEKPMTGDVVAARELVNLAQRRGAMLQVGHLARFCSVFPDLVRDVSRPVYIEADRIAPFRPRGTDVNVILDLMIHDIDLILSLVGSPVVSIHAVGTPVLSDSEDVANARLAFENGCVAVLTASRVGTKAERRVRVFQPDCYIGVDFLGRTMRTVRRDGPVSGFEDLEIEDRRFSEADELAREVEAFARAVAGGTGAPVAGADGIRALEVADRINRNIQDHRGAIASMPGGGAALSAAAGRPVDGDPLR